MSDIQTLALVLAFSSVLYFVLGSFVRKAIDKARDLPLHDVTMSTSIPPLKSVHDSGVQQVISQDPKKRKFSPSPKAWEDQLFYFFLPDRFSDGNEQTPDNLGGTTPLYTPKDEDSAIKDEKDKAEWMKAGTKFVGGTIKGATSKLPYLQHLGITSVWMGPIFKQIRSLDTYHGYAIQDFLDVDHRFGTREDLVEFVHTAHSLGIYVLLDIILNHSGDVFKYTADEMPMYDHSTTFPVKGYWDTTRDASLLLPFDTINEEKHPAAFPDGGIWPRELQPPNNFKRKGCIVHWSVAPEVVEADFYDLKSLNLGKPETKDFTPGPALLTLCEVYKFWIALCDLDGYRIDTVTYMGEGPTKYFAATIHEYARSLGKENFFLVGEISGTTALQTVRKTGLDAALGIGPIQSKLWHLPQGRLDPSKYFEEFQNSAPKDVAMNGDSLKWQRDQVVIMIDDHDQAWRPHAKGRFCSEPGAPPFLHAALGINLCTIGIPCIYYGTEQALDGGSARFIGNQDFSADRFTREAMQGGVFGPFRSKNRHCFNAESQTYKEVSSLARLRRSEIAFRQGSQFFREVSTDGKTFEFPRAREEDGEAKYEGVFAWSRIYEGDEVLCVVNTHGTQNTTSWISVEGPARNMRCIYPPVREQLLKVVPIAGSERVAVHGVFPPHSFSVYK